MEYKKGPIFLFIVLGIGVIQASKFSTHIVAFVNETDSDYVIYKRPRPIFGKGDVVYTVESADWNPILIVKAHETGEKEVLLRDPEAFGVQLKLEPKNEKLSLPTIYLKGGLKMSGSCKDVGWNGPYAIDLATDEDSVMNAAQKYDAVNRVRYCTYRNAEAIVHILGDGARIEDGHNMFVLDSEKVVFASKPKDSNE